MSNTRMYRDGALVDQGFPASEVGERLAADDRVVIWLDICGPTEDDLRLLAEELGMHELALEDVVQQAQRAKLDRYDTHLFLNTYMVRLGAAGGLTDDEVSAFVKPRALVTVRYSDRFDLRQVLARWDESAELAPHGVAFLLYGLLDTLIDGHFSAVQQLDATLERVQAAMFKDGPGGQAAGAGRAGGRAGDPGDGRTGESRGGAGRTGASRGDERRGGDGRGGDAVGVMDRNEVQQRIFLARRDLVRLRQVTLPMREVVNALMRPTMHTVDQEMLPYYQDLYDHVLRVIEWSDSLRDLNTTMLETNLMLQNNQLNLIVKQVTAWAAVIAVPTAVTGFFGQNLAFPWRHTPAEFVISLIVTLGLAVALYVVFRRKSWI
ncbi:magnesium transporter CorA family protein [Plantactinospora sp. BB1]|uniref:magnesium transporter CorA family protein n=1 Tax=Plantactinospora sp. BB1 TaxID=2071627 RepID=UPI000D164DDB|nr:magnesium transporter CorA family protein [Plantactinospora sp. BB1]AVT35203.1 magnesium transporter [Plantactinospora sp. BB1]